MDEKTQTKLHELLVNYTKNLPNRLRDLQAHWQDLCENYTPLALENFHREVHTLTGSAGTYGYATLSQVARELETALKSLLGSASLSLADEKAISVLIKKLLSVTLTSQDNLFSADNVSSNKIVYMLDPDQEFVEEVKKEFKDLGYELHQVDTFSALLAALEERKLPIALIVDTECLGDEEVKMLMELQDKNDIAIPLLCTSSRGDIATRLRAVRAGGVAFAQKPNDAFYLTKLLGQISGYLSAEEFRILIVDDSPSLSDYYALILQDAGMITHTINNPLQILDTIAEFQPDLLLLDIYMPECSGLELAAALRQQPNFMHIPIIFLSSEGDKFKQLAALSLGGDDFLTKPILPQHLVAAVQSRAKRAGVLNSYMVRDSLTGLLNHTHILHQLDMELMRARRHNLSLSYAMIDIDHFKAINDCYGHMAGDRVLKKLSELLSTRLRKTDYVGRYGGEEFGVVFPNTTPDQARKVLNELREKFAATQFNLDGKAFNVTFSAGVSGYPEFGTDVELIDIADQALYKAKQAGRNQVA